MRVAKIERWQETTDSRLRIVETIVPSKEDQKDQELRLRALEALKWQFVGAVGFVTFLSSILGAGLFKFFIEK